MITKDEVDSLLGCAARFESWALKRIQAYDRATAKAAEANRLARAAQGEREAEAKRQRMEEAERKQKTVEYVVSSRHGDYVESFVYVKKGAARSTARLTLDTEPASVEKRKAVFPQVLITPKKGRPVVLTIFGIRGWEVVDVKRSGREVDIVLEVA